MGKVYMAADTLLGGVPVAVKFLSQTLLNERMTQRFLREAMTCAQLGSRSSHVVRVTDYGLTENEELPFYVMEYLEGKNLGQIIHPKPVTVQRFLELTKQICRGLKTAHDGIVLNNQTVPIIHRDIKPSNILVTQDLDYGELVKILDFGIAKLLQTDGGEQTSSFMGTLAYASPEQMEGQELDSRSDIYSLGIVMYQMLTGSLPFRPNNNTFGGWYKAHISQEPATLSSAMATGGTPPRALADMIMSCLAKDRQQRPENVGQILDALISIENRLDPGRKVAQRIEEAVATLPVVPPKTDESEEDQFCRAQTWPQTLPVAEIVFPQLLRLNNEAIPTVWAMLDPEEIIHRTTNTRYKNFLCTLTPHPMVLWVTAFYSIAQGPRWLPVYLDLKNKTEQELAWQLGEKGFYRLLCFSSQKPHGCSSIFHLSIPEPQQKLLKEWVIMAGTSPTTGSPRRSKQMLKQEMDQHLKPKVLMNFESLHSDSKPGTDLDLGF